MPSVEVRMGDKSYTVDTVMGRVVGVYCLPDGEVGMTYDDAVALYDRRRKEQEAERRECELHHARLDALRRIMCADDLTPAFNGVRSGGSDV
jgi:hypothetical protein